MVNNQIKVRVRYSETDQMGVVYHGNYIPYFEIGRVEWLRDKGISYKDMELMGIGLPILSMQINYKRPARYDELLTIHSNYKKSTPARMEFDCEIYNEANKLLTTAHFVLAFINLKTGRPTPPPKNILDILEKIK